MAEQLCTYFAAGKAIPHIGREEMPLPPKHVQVLVIGGGPAGAYTASALAREGIEVALFEAAQFPRYHVGESLIPSVRHYLRFIGAEEKVINHGFKQKPGSAIKFNQWKREGYTDFVALGAQNNAWNVERSEFDDILLQHSRSCGAQVFEQTSVGSVQFSPDDSTTPVSVSWKQSMAAGTTAFDYLVDASGRTGVLSTKYLKNRHFNKSLKNIAVWGYWKDTGLYGLGTTREGAPFFEALTNQSGWAWFIPLRSALTSVGVVMNSEIYNSNAHLAPSSVAGASPSVSDRYHHNLSLAPRLLELIGSGSLVKDKRSVTGEVEPAVRSASDFSYSAPSYAGNGYRIVGDAGAFIDPFFSSGIHLAFTSALSAATSICASIRNDCPESLAVDWHTRRVATSYTRFQIVVLSAYKQIQAKTTDVLADIDEDNYDRAFALLRPIIQGAGDMGSRLSEKELQKSMDFCIQLFNPTSPEVFAKVAAIIPSPELLDVNAPLMTSHALENIFNSSPGKVSSVDLDETRMALSKVNARRVVQSEYFINNMEDEVLYGHVVRLRRGELGLSQHQPN